MTFKFEMSSTTSTFAADLRVKTAVETIASPNPTDHETSSPVYIDDSPISRTASRPMMRTHSGPYFASDYVPSDPNGPMFRTDSQPASDFVDVSYRSSSPSVDMADDSTPSHVPSYRGMYGPADDDSTPSHVPSYHGPADDSTPSHVPSYHGMYGPAYNSTPSYGSMYCGPYGDELPYTGSSVLGPSFYEEYDVGSPRTEGDMMMRAYLASRRG